MGEITVMEIFLTITLWVAAIGCGLMAGVYFTFSVFVMRSLAEIPATHGIAAMQSINRVIVSSAFFPLFFGTTVAGLLLAIVPSLYWNSDSAIFSAIGGAIYVVGMFICTVAFNVPLNNRLASLEPGDKKSMEFWKAYQRTWTRWNHVRTAASTTASILFIYAISLS